MILAVAIGLLAGCQDDSDEARQVVVDYLAADGADACEFLHPTAREAEGLSGECTGFLPGASEDLRVGVANVVEERATVRLSGERQELGIDGKIPFEGELRLVETDGDWRIIDRGEETVDLNGR